MSTSSLALPSESVASRPLALWSRRVCLAAFLCLSMPLCLWFALRVPLGEVADEPAHLMRAASLLDGQVLGHREAIVLPDGRTWNAAGVRVDPVWERLSRARELAKVAVTAPRPDASIGARPANGPAAFFPLYTIATYCPVFYLPGAAGLGLAQTLDLSARTATVLGRLSAALAFAGIGVAALALARRGRMLIFVVLSLPMTLSLAGSFNQDGLIIATAALAAALATRERDPAIPLRRRPALLTAAGLIALIVLAKPPYAPLAALLLLPLPRRMSPRALVCHGGLLRRTALMVLAVLPGLLWTGYAMTRVGTPIPREAYEAGPLWPGPRPATFESTDPAAQARVLTANPIRLVTVPASFLGTIKHLRFLGESAVGNLGWLDRPLPGALYLAWALAFAALALRRPAPDAGGIEAGLLIAAALACLWAVIVSQYLTWTDVGMVKVDGPQGRYLLPILPLLLPLFAPRSGVTAVAAPLWRQAAAALPYLAAALSLALVPTVMRI